MLSDIHLEFKDSGGRVAACSALDGGCGAGKTLLIDLIAMSWAGSVRKRGMPWTLHAEMARVDFEFGGEVAAVHIRGDRVDGHPLLAAKFDKERDREMVLKYDSSRISGMRDWTNTESSNTESGIAATYPILADLHFRDVRDSVILIDDFDLALSQDDTFSFFRYLQRHYIGRNNQLILTGHSLPKIGAALFHLPDGSDPIEKSKQLIKHKT